MIKKQQKEQTPLSLPRKQSYSGICDICQQLYHILGRWPMLACSNGHFFCDYCIESMFRYTKSEPCPCPICRTLIKRSKVKTHSKLFNIINVESKIQATVGEEEKQLFLYAFKHQIYEIARIFKQRKKNSEVTNINADNRSLIKIQHLEPLYNLRVINMQRNYIESVSGLEKLKNLKIINLSRNLIVDISPIAKLKKIQVLALQFNRIQLIKSLQLFQHIMHLFLWNPLQQTFIDNILNKNLFNLKTLSISFEQQTKQQNIGKFVENAYLKSNLNRLITQDTLSQSKNQKVSKIRLAFVGSEKSQIQQHQQRLRLWLQDYVLYGSVYAFKPDLSNSSIKFYNIQQKKITKLNSTFTIINSDRSILKFHRQNFKIRLEEASQHMVIGICNDYLKHNANVYSEHFVGITLWGWVYSRGQASQIYNKLHLDSHPIIRMCIDFEQENINWFCDELQVARTVLPSEFRYSQLYFVIGMRDEGTAVTILDE